MKIVYTLLFTSLSLGMFGQEKIPLDSFPTFTAIKTQSKGLFHLYTPKYKLKKQSLDTLDISLTYPEEVLLAFICAKDNSWIDFVSETGDGKKRYKKATHYKAIQSANPNALYFELEAKFSFIYQGRSTTFIKYTIVDELNGLRVRAIKAMVNVNGRYKVSKTPIDGNLGFALIFIKNKVLKSLFPGQREPYKELYDKVYENGSLNLLKLTSEFTSWYEDEEKYKNEIEKYTTSPNW